MFRQAYAIAAKFTWPVVISRVTISGQCSSAIGTITVINDEGWFLTAAHILRMIDELGSDEAQTAAHEQQIDAITNDPSLDRATRRARLARLGKRKPDATKRASAWWGRDEPRIVHGEGIEGVDIGVGRLQPFDPAWVDTYPVIKDPNKDFQPGVSLCRLGFPFHSITPLYDENARSFQLPAGSVPIPLFPIEGILTRIAVLIAPHQAPATMPPFPLLQIETSSPGLRGQSGGPIFDTQGTVWGIQSATRPIPLGFDPEVPGTNGKRKEHQFLNVGLGVHPVTIMGLLRQLNVRFQVSAY
jgi:hypothetical protein